MTNDDPFYFVAFFYFHFIKSSFIRFIKTYCSLENLSVPGTITVEEISLFSMVPVSIFRRCRGSGRLINIDTDEYCNNYGDADSDQIFSCYTPAVTELNSPPTAETKSIITNRTIAEVQYFSKCRLYSEDPKRAEYSSRC